MFHSPNPKTDDGRDMLVEFERHELHVAIEKAKAEGFVGMETALRAMLKALDDSTNYPDF